MLGVEPKFTKYKKLIELQLEELTADNALGQSAQKTVELDQHSSDGGSLMTKHFCGICGTPMFTENSSREGMLGLRAGIINEHEEFLPKVNVYISSKMKATALDDGIPAFEKMPG